MQYSFFPPSLLFNFRYLVRFLLSIDVIHVKTLAGGTFQIAPDAENAPCAGYCAALWFVLIIQQKADDEHNR
jgi:hypothetical protein